MPRHRRQVGRVLTHEPVQELLERLARKLPEEHERVRGAEAAAEPVEHGAWVGATVLLLQDDGPDSGAREDKDEGEKAIRARVLMWMLWRSSSEAMMKELKMPAKLVKKDEKARAWTVK